MADKDKEPQPDPKEPQQDPDAAVMRGGPGQEPPEEPEEEPGDELVEVTLSGKKVKVEPELAQLLEQREQEFNRKLNQNSDELGRLRKLATPKEEPKKDEGVNYDELIFENPTQALTRFKEDLIKEIRQEYTQDKSQEAFWVDFYSANDDLKRQEDDFIVKAVMQRNWSELQDLRPGEAASKLADLTRREILRLSKRVGSNESNDNDRTRVEGASATRRRPAAPKDDEGATSLTDIIKRRRAARRTRAGAA